jgi:hypothetical protein
MSDEKKEYTINIFYHGKHRDIKAEVIYESAQIQRIKVHGSKTSITLQNNYPMAKMGKRGIQWKLIDGNPNDPKFFTELLQKLEQEVKHQQ